MNIKEKIGQRISEVRNHRGYTLAELSEITGYSAGRLSNWERGTRTPGPEEAITLAQALKIVPAYLLCLVDDIELDPTNCVKLQTKLLPLFNIQSIQNDSSIITNNSMGKPSESTLQLGLVPIGERLLNHISEGSYAIVLNDTSMQPDFQSNDVIIIDPDRNPQPSDFVLSLNKKSKNLTFRK